MSGQKHSTIQHANLPFDGSTTIAQQLASKTTVESIAFNFSSGVQVLSTLSIGMILSVFQIDIDNTFSDNSRIQLGTSVNAGQFIDIDGSIAGSFSSSAIEEIDVNDLLILTISTTGGNGNGKVYYGIQSS